MTWTRSDLHEVVQYGPQQSESQIGSLAVISIYLLKDKTLDKTQIFAGKLYYSAKKKTQKVVQNHGDRCRFNGWD